MARCCEGLPGGSSFQGCFLLPEGAGSTARIRRGGRCATRRFAAFGVGKIASGWRSWEKRDLIEPVNGNMNLRNRITSDLNAAMKRREALCVATLRMLLATIQNREIELRSVGMLGDDEVMRLIRSEAHKRRDAIEGYERGARPELAEKEREELCLLGAYLPAEVDDDLIAAAVKNAVASIGAKSQQDFGRVMKEAMRQLSGKASGERVSQAVRRALS